MKILLYVVFVSLLCSSCVRYVPTKTVAKTAKPSPYEMIDFEGILKRYLGKDFRPNAPLEGIYEVSCTVSKTSKGLFSKNEKVRVVGRFDNFAKIAIVKDWPDSRREYLEISLNSKNAPSYPIIGEFQSFSEGGGFIYKHFVPKGPALSFTFARDMQSDLLEGVRSVVKRSKTFTYTMSYLKVYPKKGETVTP